MKNKEIEELLNQIKFEYSNKEKWRTDLALTVDGWNLLLSYIEQLENLCNKYEQEHKTTFKIWKEDIKKLKQWDKNKDTRNSRQRIANAILTKKNKQLENNRDKAIKLLESIYFLDNVEITNNALEKIDKTINILKGDSDE